MGAVSTVQPYLPLGYETLNFRSVLNTSFPAVSSTSALALSTQVSKLIRTVAVASQATAAVSSSSRISRLCIVSSISTISTASSAANARVRNLVTTSVVSTTSTTSDIRIRQMESTAHLVGGSSVPTLLSTVTVTPIESTLTVASYGTANRYTNAVSTSRAHIDSVTTPFIVLRNGAIRTGILPQEKASGTVLVPVAPPVSNTLVLVPTSKPTGDIVVNRNNYLYDGF